MSINYNYEHSIPQDCDIGIYCAKVAWWKRIQMVEEKYHCCKLTSAVTYRVFESQNSFHTVYQFQVDLPDRRMSTIFDLEVVPQLKLDLEQQRQIVAKRLKSHRDAALSNLNFTSLAGEIAEEIDNTVRNSFK